jgi:hypothetical protein
VPDGSALVELTLVPTQAWSGSALVDPTGSYIRLSFTAAGLHNILANANLKAELFLDAEITLNNTLRQQLRAATEADDAYLVYKSRTPKAKIMFPILASCFSAPDVGGSQDLRSIGTLSQ